MGRWRKAMLLLGGMAWLALCLFIPKERVAAQGFSEYGFLEYAPDGKAWTVREALPNPADAYNRVNPSCWYPRGETVIIREQAEREEPGTGQHEYVYERKDVIPVGYWKVAHSQGKCIHRDAQPFHGITGKQHYCLSSYYSGWVAYCADCGDPINNFYIYVSRAKIGLIREINTELDYYYLCPTCDNMEQGRGFHHVCRNLSANRYRVVYLPGEGNVSGFMQSSFHMYDNAVFFEGEPVTPVKNLNLNVFQRRGYRFDGWNTMPDGNGARYDDGQEILNLTAENYHSETGAGTVRLYAQWRKVTGELLIDPGEGAYLGKRGITSVSVRYGEDFYLESNLVMAPEGHRVRFDVMGGEPLEDVMGKTYLIGWQLQKPSHGLLREDCYQFLGEDGQQDKVSAIYQTESILLPMPVRLGYSFGGWYYDRELTEQAGQAGEPFTPSGEVTLYASWVDLVLRADLNLLDHEGRGAVDLSWFQNDGREKSYLLYQKREGEDFQKIYNASSTWDVPETMEFTYSGSEESYEIPATGTYRLVAKGAQGQNLQDAHGGKGGSVEGTFYLEKGDKLHVVVGKQGGTEGEENAGGQGSGADGGAGGGSTRISSEKLGLLLVAGGGGGALPGLNGGAGGLEDGLREDALPEGQDGQAGGGAGWIGGKAGVCRRHVHTERCVHVHRGNLSSGGDCYREVTETKNCRVSVVGPISDLKRISDCTVCLQMGRNGHDSMHVKCWWIVHLDCGKPTDMGSHGWWFCTSCGLIGYQWGTGTSRPTVEDHFYQEKKYVLDCSQAYECGNPEPVILTSHGGSSFVREELARSRKKQAGVQEGDGKFEIIPVNVGFCEGQELRAVFAPDLRAPDQIDAATVCMDAVGEHLVRVSFAKPADQGTVYYHMVQSFLAGSEAVLSTSNVPSTNVVTGVAGYYYVLDSHRDTAVTKENADNKELLRENEVTLSLPDDRAYLHLAAMDYAGNVGESLTIEFSLADCDLPWQLMTNPVAVSSIIAGKEYGSVAEAGDGAYYVRANGRTPFLLSFVGEIQGKAGTTYQIDGMTFAYALRDGGTSGSHGARLPKSNQIQDEVEISGEQLRYFSQGSAVLQAGMYAKALRRPGLKSTVLEQSFTMDESLSGKQVQVVPSVTAWFQLEEKASDPARDAGNAVILIGDGEAPLILGTEEAEAAFAGFRGAREDRILDLTAEDGISGMAGFWAELYNWDNFEEAVFYPDAEGHIRILLDKESPLFSGDFRLTVYAVDRVGNERMVECNAREFDLKTEIIRLLPPHDPLFKKGESGVLKVTVRGYAERVEIEFPEEFTDVCPELNRTCTYEVPRESVSEEVLFMVPLYLDGDGTYEITVRAYKGERILWSRPELCAFQVSEESILKELRTKLR